MSGAINTRSQVSDHPASNAVTTAVSADAQQADVERKLKLYGVIQAFRDGRMPTNAQCNEALEYFGTHSPVDLAKLSPDGKLLIEDFRDILESARMMILEKNEGELLQNFIYSTTVGDPTRGQKSKDEVLPVGQRELKNDGKEAATHLRVLFTLFFTNSEARKLLTDVGYISRDMFATAAQRGADKIRPDQEQLDQVDKEAPSGEWIGADGKRVGKDETPELQLKGPKGTEFRMNPKDDVANAKTVDHQGNERSAGEAYNEASSRYQDAKSQAQDAKNQAKSEAQNQADQQGGSQGIKDQLIGHAKEVVNSDDPKAAAKSKAQQAKGAVDERTPDRSEMDSQIDQNTPEGRNAKEKLRNAIPDEHKERMDRGVEKTKDFFNENFPQERRDQFIYRLKKVVSSCQEHKDYQEAVNFFIEKAETYKGHAQHVTGKGGESAQAVAEDPAYQTAFIQFRTLLERFANNNSMEPLMDSINDVYRDSADDRELHQWFNKATEYIKAVLLEPGYILEDESTKDGERLQESGKKFFGEGGKYHKHAQTFSNRVQDFFGAMGEDPLNLRLGDDIKRLFKDLLYDSEGSLTFKPKLWNDVRRVVLPSIAKNIGYVPIPRAEYSDDTIDLVIENLVLQGANILPNVVHIGNQSAFTFSPYDNIKDSSHNTFTLGASQIQADIKDCMFAFRKKKGFPKIKDSGLANVLIGGKGISIEITLETVENRRDSVVKVKNTIVEIDTLKFTITDSHHDLLYKFIKVTATGIIKKAIQAAIKAAIHKAVSELDDQLVEVRNRLNEAKDSDDMTRTDALKNLYQRKKETAKETKQEADEKTGTFKIVTSKEDSIVPDFDKKMASASWTKKAFRTEDVSKQGNEWRSPVFSLFHDDHPASSNITKASMPASAVHTNH